MHVPVRLVLVDAETVCVNESAHGLDGPVFSFTCASAESVGLRNKLLRKVEELKNESDCSGVPDEFLCPITRELMRDPVIAAGKERAAVLYKCGSASLCALNSPCGCLLADGYSYERDAIESWIHTKNRSSPMTNLPLLTTLLTPNHTLKMAIGRWKTSSAT